MAGGRTAALSYVPLAWLVFVMAWSVYGLISAWRLVGDYGLPDRVLYLVHGGLVADIVTILWGLYLLGLAFGRSARFPRHFTIWQIAIIVWLLARQAYVLAVPDFVFSARSLAITAAEIAIGLLCIYLLRRGSGAETVYASPQTESPSVFVSIVAALLGIILGAVIGAVRRLRRRLGDRRCHRHELLRGRLRLFSLPSSAWPGWWSAPSPAACSPSGSFTGASGSRRHRSGLQIRVWRLRTGQYAFYLSF